MHRLAIVLALAALAQQAAGSSNSTTPDDSRSGLNATATTGETAVSPLALAVNRTLKDASWAQSLVDAYFNLDRLEAEAIFASPPEKPADYKKLAVFGEWLYVNAAVNAMRLRAAAATGAVLDAYLARQAANLPADGNRSLYLNMTAFVGHRLLERSFEVSEAVPVRHVKRIYYLCRRHSPGELKVHNCIKSCTQILIFRRLSRLVRINSIKYATYYLSHLRSRARQAKLDDEAFDSPVPVDTLSGVNNMREYLNRREALLLLKPIGMIEDLEDIINRTLPLVPGSADDVERELFARHAESPMYKQMEYLKQITAGVIDEDTARQIDAVSIDQVYRYAELVHCGRFGVKFQRDLELCTDGARGGRGPSLGQYQLLSTLLQAGTHWYLPTLPD